MADTTTLQATPPKKEGIRSNIIGLLDDTFEMLIGRGGDVNEGPVSTEQLRQTAGPDRQEIRHTQAEAKLAIGGRTEYVFSNPDETALREQRAAITEAEMALRRSRTGFILQEELRHEVAGMSEVERNERLHLNTSLRKKLTEDAYHTTELYRQKKEELVKAEQIKNATEIPSPAKQPSALDAAFEGRSGSQGGGTANLSAQAVG